MLCFFRQLIISAALCTAFAQPVNIPQVTINVGETVFETDYLYERGFSLKNRGTEFR